MKINQNETVRFIEPIFHFCVKRLNSRHDAEDLASEIMVHVLNGLQKYEIDSLEKWVWHIAKDAVAKMEFYGSNFDMERLGYIALSTILRSKVRDATDGLSLQSPPYPPRKDGGYGWFIIEETETEEEKISPTSAGCNASGNENDFIYYSWIGKYYGDYVYHSGGTTWMSHKEIVGKT
ncbi:MAG: hypothetical protein FWC32_01295 [Firmicutes bacterium]|nr:hypothetical protein [Bacillota bacterium]